MSPTRPINPPDHRRHTQTRPAGTAKVAFMALLILITAACGAIPASSGPPPPPITSAALGSTPTDAAFVLHMLPHHQRALQVGALGAAKGSDPRVRAFGQRILTEQTPEEQRLTGWVSGLHLNPGPTDAAMAQGYIDDTTYRRLQSESGAAFDRDMLLLSARSETGAAAMSRDELAAGAYPPARDLATAISTARTGEIPQLQALAAQLP
jgi:uncharacterized protein (DUF305 family)